MRRAAVRIAAGVAVLLAAALAAGCGSGGGRPATGGAEGARLVPSDTAIFASVRAVPGSEQWQAAQTLLDRFPSGADSVEALLDKLADGAGQHELEAALGDEVDVAVLDVTAGERPPTVLLARPADPAELERLLAAADETPAWIVKDGWYLVAESRATLDRAIAGTEAGSLSSSNGYTTALDGLPGDGLASLYVSGDALKAVATSGGKQSLASFAGEISAVGAVALAEPQGVRIEGSVRLRDGPGDEGVRDDARLAGPGRRARLRVLRRSQGDRRTAPRAGWCRERRGTCERRVDSCTGTATYLRG